MELEADEAGQAQGGLAVATWGGHDVRGGHRDSPGRPRAPCQPAHLCGEGGLDERVHDAAGGEEVGHDTTVGHSREDYR